ncbi:MAG: class I SAM-dependent methyltransferase [Gemmatimonadetes bacterium]|nr:class I SAM-dependent methyltransferase [Gemmatimonadota bacterium]
MSGETAFRETDIRPDDLMAEARRLLEEDTRRLIADRADFVAVDCPACGEDDAAPRWHKRGMRFVECRRCKTAYGSPRPTPERLARYYREAEYYDYWNAYIYPQSEDARRERIFGPRADRIAELAERHGARTGTLVEVGAGSGIFCDELRARGMFERIVAVEPTPSSAAAIRERGMEVREARIEDVDLSDVRVDVIAAFEVLEHLFDPLAFVETCAGHLSAGGLLVLTCPNGRGFDVATLGEAADTVTPEHLNYFHPESLAHLMTRGGLEVLEVLTPGRLDAEIVRKKTLAGEFSLAGQPFLERVLLDDWETLGAPFQRFLAENRLSSPQWIVARRAS